jgi:peroxiredoxin
MKRPIISLFVAAAACCVLYAGQEPAKDAPQAAAQAFSLPTLEGKTFKLEENLGKGYVVLNFWARWCTSCQEEIPELAALRKLPGADKALFVGVDVGDSAEKAAKFVAKNKYPYQVVLDKDKAVAKKYGVLGLPVTIIISRDRRIVFRGSRPPKAFDFGK